MVHTEYHLMVSASLVIDKYNDPGEYEVIILQTKDNDSKRFQFELNLSVFKTVTYKTLCVKSGDFRFDQSIHDTIKNIINQKIDIYIGFLEQHALNIYFAKQLKPSGTVICLAPDGTKPYGSITKAAIPSRIRMTWSNYRFLFANRLKVYSFNLIDWNYGRMKELDEVWLSNEGHYQNTKQKKIRIIEIFSTPASVVAVCKLFNFNQVSQLATTDRIIFYVNQPVNNEEIYRYEIEILKEYTRAHPDHFLCIKCHPKTPSCQLDIFKNHLSATVILDTIPAELYIATLTDSVVISFWSAASLINNKTCRFYWLMPLLKKKGIMVNWLNLVNPTEHIIEPESLSEVI